MSKSACNPQKRIPRFATFATSNVVVRTDVDYTKQRAMVSYMMFQLKPKASPYASAFISLLLRADNGLRCTICILSFRPLPSHSIRLSMVTKDPVLSYSEAWRRSNKRPAAPSCFRPLDFRRPKPAIVWHHAIHDWAERWKLSRTIRIQSGREYRGLNFDIVASKYRYLPQR